MTNQEAYNMDLDELRAEFFLYIALLQRRGVKIIFRP